MTPPIEEDPIRLDIRAAMSRLLSGIPTQSDGKLTVKSLALEAGVKRHLLTHKHTDLKDEFYGRVAAQNGETPEVARLRTELDRLRVTHDRTKSELADAELRVKALLREVHLLTVENAQLSAPGGVVSAIRPRQPTI